MLLLLRVTSSSFFGRRLLSYFPYGCLELVEALSEAVTHLFKVSLFSRDTDLSVVHMHQHQNLKKRAPRCFVYQNSSSESRRTTKIIQHGQKQKTGVHFKAWQVIYPIPGTSNINKCNRSGSTKTAVIRCIFLCICLLLQGAYCATSN
jgi:hypothetical protein